MNNRFSKYLLYAVGEIVLVVIGILIALQVNNANQARKERKVELKILRTIHSDITQDIVNLDTMMGWERNLIVGNQQLINLLKNDTISYQNGMDSLFGNMNRYYVFYPQQIGYESLKSTGMDLLRSDSLKENIVMLYDFHYELIAETMELKKQLYLETNPIFLPHLITVGELKERYSVTRKRPVDFNALKEDQEFYNYLTHIYHERINFLRFAESTMEIMLNVRDEVEREVNAMSDD
jgi:hypothetical protein